jgi:hypothetical protein
MVMARWARQPVVTMSAAICLPHPAERGNDVRCQVNGHLTWQFDHEPGTFFEEARESLDWRSHA